MQNWIQYNIRNLQLLFFSYSLYVQILLWKVVESSQKLQQEGEWFKGNGLKWIKFL